MRFRFGLASKAPLDGDETVAGLLARSIRHGRPAAFFPGQQYAGSLGTFLIAGAEAVFGQTFFALRIFALLESIVILVLIVLISQRSGGNRVVALGLAAVWPLGIVAYSVREYTTYNVGVILACFVWLLAVRAPPAAHLRRIAWLCLLGLASGLAFWTSVQTGTIIVPCLVVVAMALRRQSQRAIGVLAFAISAFVGALPWLYRNLHTHFLSLQSSAIILHPEPYWRRLLISARGLVFQPFGDTAHAVGQKLPNTPIVLVLGITFLVLIAVAARRGVNVLAAVILIAYPFVGALNPLSGQPAGQFRYVFYAWPALIVLIAHIANRSPRLLPAFAVLVAAAVATSWQYQVPWSTASRRSAEVLVDSLRHSNAGVILASYWDAYTIEYLCGASCPRTVPYFYVRNTPDEPDPPLQATYILAGTYSPLAQVSATLTGAGIAFETVALRAPGYYLLHLARPVSRFELGASLGP